MAFDLSEAEWRELRAEVRGHVNETRRLETLSVVASGTVYAWLTTHWSAMGDLGVLPWIIPFLFAAAGASRSYALGKQIDTTAEYLLKLEQSLGKERDSELGWEKYFEPRRGQVYRSAVGFWLVFIAITFIVPFIIHYITPA